MSTRRAADFVGKYDETAAKQWKTLHHGTYGMSADTTTADAKTSQYTYPVRITGIVPGGQAEKLGLRAGDRITAIQLLNSAAGGKVHKVHEISAVASDNNMLIQVVDKQTQILLKMAAACRIYVALIPRCGTHKCSGEMTISDDSTDLSMVCMKCGVVAASRMAGVFEEEFSDVQRKEIWLQRLAPSLIMDEGASMVPDTYPQFEKVNDYLDKGTSGILLRNAAERMHKEENGRGVKKLKKQEQEAETDIVMEQICKCVDLPPFVFIRASKNFNTAGRSCKYSFSDTGYLAYKTHVMLACIFDAANFHKQPRTIWHLISNTREADNIMEAHVMTVMERFNFKNTEIDPFFLMETVYKFYPKLKCNISAAQAVLGQLNFFKSTNAQEKVALAIVYTTAILSGQIIDEKELSTVVSFLNVKEDAIRKLLQKNPFKSGQGGQGGVGK